MHSTQIKMLDEHCPQALDWAMRHNPWISEARLDLGVAAHAVLQLCAGQPRQVWKRIADGAIERLAYEGYEWDGEKQPPLKISECQEGKRLAMRWLELYGAEPKHAVIERGYAIDGNGKPCDYKGGALQAIIDLVREDVIEEEEYQYRQVTIADYKSAWTADEKLFDGLQAKIQAVTVTAHIADWDVLRLEIRNLRTLQIHSMQISNDDEGQALLKEWKHDALQAANVARKALKNPVAVPGSGCVGCPYIIVCAASESALESSVAAQAWTVAKARADALRPIVAKAAKDAPVVLPDGGVVKYQEKTRQTVSDDVARLSWDAWGMPRSDEAVGLLEAAKLGVTQVRNIGKVVKKVMGEAPAEDYVDAALEEKTVPELTIEKR